MVVDESVGIRQKVELSFVTMKLVITHVTSIPRAVHEPPFVVDKDDIPCVVGIRVGVNDGTNLVTIALGVSTDRLCKNIGLPVSK